MTTKTKTATTAHGEVEYEVVECTSCGNEIDKGNAKRFIIADNYEYTKRASHIDYNYQYSFDSTVKRGWACEYCRENDPIRYPQKDNRILRKNQKRMVIVGLMVLNFCIGLLFGVAIL